MRGKPISRRDFLKILGYGSVALVLGPLIKLGGLERLKLLAPIPAAAQSSGSWVQGPQTTVVAIHAALLTSGKIFYLAGSGYHNTIQTGPYQARILDVNSGLEQNYQQSEDLFCIGLTGLPNGNVLLAGGTLLYDINVNNCNGNWHGLNAAYEVDGSSESVDKVSSMAHGRWYPTCITLPDGKVSVVNGLDEYGVYNLLVEVYDPISKTWTKKFDPNTSATYCVGAGEQSVCPGAGSPCYGGSNNGVAPNVGLYPRMHLMPSGLVMTCGEAVTVRSWDPATGIWNIVTQTSSYRNYGTTFLLPLNNTPSERGKILIVGGDPTPSTESAIKTAEILDFNAGSSTNPVLRSVASMSKARKFLLPIILPTGKCVVFGGYNPTTDTYTNTPEMFDPVAETWTDLPTASVQRGYHGVALLLTDGRVWTAGNATPNNPSTFELQTEIFSPGYYFQTRPTISGQPSVGDYSGAIVVPTPDGPTIDSVSLVRLGTATHHYDPNARLIWLQLVSSTSNSVTVSAPLNSRLAPPGYYMIHVLKGGVPSIAKIIKIPGTASPPDTIPPAQVAGLSITAASSTQLNLSWTANTELDLNHYNVYRGTTAGFPVTLGTTIPVATPNTSSYSNTGLSPSTTYYYKVSAVDNAGNIGTLSTERSGTTAVDTTPPSVAITSPANNSTVGSLTVAVAGTSADSGSGIKRIMVRIRAGTTATAYTLATPVAPNDWSTWSVSMNLSSAGPTGPYILEARAEDNAGNLQWSNDVIVNYSASPDTTPPAQVAGLSVTAASSTQLNLSWTANTELDLNHYNVYRGTTAGFAVTLGTTIPVATPNTSSYSNTGLSPSTTYYYKVSAVDNAGNIGPLSLEQPGTTLTPADTIPPAQVAGLSVSAASSTQLNLSWTANTELDLNHYNVYRGTTAGFAVTLGTTIPVATPNTSSYSNTGLSPSTTYYYKVSAVDNAGNIGPLSLEQPGTTLTPADTIPPAQVAGLSVTAASSTQLNLSWTANTELDLNHYNVYRGTTAGFPVTLGTTIPVATPNTSSYSNTGLSPSTTYYYKVSAVDNAGNIGTLSTERSGTTSATSPDTTPPSVAITSPANNSTVGSLTVAVAGTSADSGSGIKRIMVRIRAGTTATAYTLATPVAPNDWSTWSVSMNLSSAGPTGPYILEARAEDNAGNLQWSNDVIVNYSASPDTTPPAQVAGLSVTAASSTQLNLSWTANTELDLNHYNVYRGTTAGFAVTLGTTIPVATPNTSSYSNTGLSPSTTYYYKVSAVDNAGNIGTLSTERFATTLTPADTTPPAQVAGLSVTAASSTQLNLSWTANTELDLNHYNVYRGTTAGFAVTLGTTIPVATPNTSSYSNTGLSPSTTYYYKVSAVDNAGNIGTLSTERFATTLTPADTTPPAQVAGLSVTAASSTQLNLSWTANTELDLNHYNVYRGTTAGFAVTLGTTIPVATPNTSSYSNTGLSPSTTYYYKVSAVDNAGNIGTLSTERSGTTSATSPDTTPPSVAITSPANNSTVGSLTVAVAGTSADSGSGIKRIMVRIRAGTTATAYTLATPVAPNDWSTWSVSMNLSSAGPTGPYILEARAEDNAGNLQWSNDVIVNYTA